MFSCEYYEIFKNTSFQKHLRTVASENISDHSQNTNISKENVEVDDNTRNCDNDDELK